MAYPRPWVSHGGKQAPCLSQRPHQIGGTEHERPEQHGSATIMAKAGIPQLKGLLGSAGVWAARMVPQRLARGPAVVANHLLIAWAASE